MRGFATGTHRRSQRSPGCSKEAACNKRATVTLFGVVWVRSEATGSGSLPPRRVACWTVRRPDAGEASGPGLHRRPEAIGSERPLLLQVVPDLGQFRIADEFTQHARMDGGPFRGAGARRRVRGVRIQQRVRTRPSVILRLAARGDLTRVSTCRGSEDICPSSLTPFRPSPALFAAGSRNGHVEASYRRFALLAIDDLQLGATDEYSHLDGLPNEVVDARRSEQRDRIRRKL